MKPVMIVALAIAASLSAAIPPVVAQTRSGAVDDQDVDQPLQQQQQPAAPVNRTGRVAQSAVGAAGERQTAAQIRGDVPPLARLSTRVQNRVQSRIRNRIDRLYDPRANANDPFAVAEDQLRTAGRPNR